MLLHNAGRGEVPVTIGGVELILAAELGRIASAASVTGASDWGSLVQKILLGEPHEVRAGIEAFAVRGNVEKAVDRFDATDLPAFQTAVTAMFSSHVKPGGRKSESKKPAKFAWYDWQEAAYGGLGWSPQAFWSATLVEFFAANEGLALAKGLRKKAAPPSRERLEEMKRRYG